MSKKKEQNLDKILANENIVDEEITNILYDSTLNYALSVITDRALPDAKDGLKPVQRRILWASYVKNIMPNSNFVKCAQVSGEVMGKYHPHGCLRGDTKIYLTDGRVANFKQLYYETLKNPNRRYRVLCLDKDFNLTVGFMHSVRIGQKTNKVYKIIFGKYNSICATSNHPFLVIEDNQYVYKEVKDLKVGDKICNGTLFQVEAFTKQGKPETLNVVSVNGLEKMTLSLIKDFDVKIEYENTKPPKQKKDKKGKIITIPRKNVVKTKHVSEIEATQDKPFKEFKTIRAIQEVVYEAETPMFDFTVEDYENAFVITAAEKDDKGLPKYKLVNVHNSSYNTIANMSQPWTFRYPLMDFHGNNGDMDGFPPSAERYTETRLHKNSLALLNGVDEKAVEFKPNYDETTEEPVYLPGLLPNLLINGAYGIAVGYTTKFPSHNLNEVIDGIIATIKNPNITLEELLNYIKGPDMPLGGYLVNNSNIKTLYETGTAKLTFKGKYHLEDNKENNNQMIVFTELPPDCNKPKLMQTLYKLCIEDKEIPRIVDIRDETTGNSTVRVIIELHKTAIVDMVLKDLFKKTNLQQDVSYIMRCVDDNQPKLLSLIELIKIYINFHTDCYINKFNYLVQKQQHKLHIQEGYNKILTNLDKAINIIRKAVDDKLLKQDLIKTFGLDEEQVNVVLEMKLRSLTKLSSDDVNNTINKLNADIQSYDKLLNDKTAFNKNFINDLLALKKQLGDDRRTELIKEEDIQVEEVAEDYILSLTNTGKIKYFTEEQFNNLTKYKERQDLIVKSIKYNTANNILMILENGQYICLPFNFILGDLSKVTKSKIIDIIEYESNIDKKLFVMTDKSTISKVNLDKIKFKKLYPLIQLQDEKIIKTTLVEDTDDEVFTVVTNDGKIARHFIKSFSSLNPGNKGLKLSYDNVVDFSTQNKQFIICTDSKNCICKFQLADFLVKGRISKPITACKSNDIAHIYIVDDLKYITNKGEKQEFDMSKIKINNKNTKPIDYKLDINYIIEI